MGFNKKDLEELTKRAKNHQRKRAPAIMHPDEYLGPQVLINLILPESYVPPHMHPHRREMWIFLSGRGHLLYFDNFGKFTEAITLSKDENLYTEVPEGRYHGFVADEPTCFINVSQGPHNFKTYKAQANWAPGEDSEGAREYFERLKELVK